MNGALRPPRMSCVSRSIREISSAPGLVHHFQPNSPHFTSSVERLERIDVRVAPWIQYGKSVSDVDAES